MRRRGPQKDEAKMLTKQIEIMEHCWSLLFRNATGKLMFHVCMVQLEMILRLHRNDSYRALETRAFVNRVGVDVMKSERNDLTHLTSFLEISTSFHWLQPILVQLNRATM